MAERQLQSDITKWLKSQGAYVIKTRPGPGTPVGCPDIIALFGWAWIAIEVKKDANSPFRVGQKATIDHLRKWAPNVFVVHSRNWASVKAELAARFF